MSASAIGCVYTISVFSPMRTLVLSMEIMSPSTAVILPRTRVGSWAAALTAARSSTSASLLRRLDAIFADRHARRHELAVALDTRPAEDGLARLEVGAGSRHEGHHLCLGGHHDLLLAVLVLQRDLVCRLLLEKKKDVGVGHHRIRGRIPCPVHLGHLRSNGMDFLGHHAAVGSLHRRDADARIRPHICNGGPPHG